MERRGGATCGADESEGDGASSYVNSHICNRVIDSKGEIIVHPWVPGRLQEGHLEIEPGVTAEIVRVPTQTQSQIIGILPGWCWWTLLSG